MLNHFVSQLQLTTSQAMETLEMVSLNLIHNKHMTLTFILKNSLFFMYLPLYSYITTAPLIQSVSLCVAAAHTGSLEHTYV